jgi:hypothetical protein
MQRQIRSYESDRHPPNLRTLVTRLPYFECRLQQLGSPLKDILPGDKLGLALNDPAFLANLARFFVDADLPVPNWLLRYLPYRAYMYLMGQRTDTAMVMAYAIAQSRIQADRLKTLLLARDITLEQIAARCKIRVEDVRIFHDLFWNVHERLDEELFMTELLEREGSRHMELAYANGQAAVRTVIWAQNQSGSELQSDLKHEILAGALKGVKQGRHSRKDNPLLEKACPLLPAGKDSAEDEDQKQWKRTSEHPRLGQLLQEGFTRKKNRELLEQLEIQRGNEAQPRPVHPLQLNSPT